MADSDLVAILQQIRDNQKLQLERQAEALALQREHAAMVRQQAERHDRIQDRAEQIQARGAELMTVARKSLFILLPLVTVLILYVSWLLFR